MGGVKNTNLRVGGSDNIETIRVTDMTSSSMFTKSIGSIFSNINKQVSSALTNLITGNESPATADVAAQNRGSGASVGYRFAANDPSSSGLGASRGEGSSLSRFVIPSQPERREPTFLLTEQAASGNSVRPQTISQWPLQPGYPATTGKSSPPMFATRQSLGSGRRDSLTTPTNMIELTCRSADQLAMQPFPPAQTKTQAPPANRPNKISLTSRTSSADRPNLRGSGQGSGQPFESRKSSVIGQTSQSVAPSPSFQPFLPGSQQLQSGPQTNRQRIPEGLPGPTGAGGGGLHGSVVLPRRAHHHQKRDDSLSRLFRDTSMHQLSLRSPSQTMNTNSPGQDFYGEADLADLSSSPSLSSASELVFRAAARGGTTGRKATTPRMLPVTPIKPSVLLKPIISKPSVFNSQDRREPSVDCMPHVLPSPSTTTVPLLTRVPSILDSINFPQLNASPSRYAASDCGARTGARRQDDVYVRRQSDAFSGDSPGRFGRSMSSLQLGQAELVEQERDHARYMSQTLNRPTRHKPQSHTSKKHGSGGDMTADTRRGKFRPQARGVMTSSLDSREYVETEELRRGDQRPRRSSTAASQPKRYFTTLPHSFKHDNNKSSNAAADKPYASTKLTRRHLQIKAQNDDDCDLDDDDDWC